MMDPPEFIQTERLTLKKILLADAQAIFDSFAQDPEVTKFLVWRPHRTIDETMKFEQSRVGAWHNGSEFTWMVRLAGDTLIGYLGLRTKDFKSDIGYVFAKAHWG